jgi:hypothetical protein
VRLPNRDTVYGIAKKQQQAPPKRGLWLYCSVTVHRHAICYGLHKNIVIIFPNNNVRLPNRDTVYGIAEKKQQAPPGRGLWLSYSVTVYRHAMRYEVKLISITDLTRLQLEREDASFTGDTFNSDIALMCFDNVLDDRESETSPSDFP